VFGCGAVGLSAVMAAAVCGCSNIVAADVNASRLTLAKELGATHTLLLTGDEEPGKRSVFLVRLFSRYSGCLVSIVHALCQKARRDTHTVVDGRRGAG
jgi:Zn-dependent alcohol dehydrogenase